MPKLTTLANGVRVASYYMPHTETVAVSVWVDVGSRHETDEESGLSHFLEHMAFKGTKRRTALQIAEEFDNIGGYLNAYTSCEHTVFYAKTLKTDAPLAFDILGDILQNSTFDQEELEKERGVVLQEIAMTNDTPDDIIFDHFQSVAFKNQPLGRSILGTTDHIASFTQESLHHYVNTHYSADRVVIGVAGNIAHEDAVNYATEHFSDLKSLPAFKQEKAHYTNGEYRENRDLEQVHMVMGVQGHSYMDKEIYAIQILANILGGGMSSRLFQEIREKRGLAYSISAYTSNYHDLGMFNIYSSTTPEQAEQLLTAIKEELDKAKRLITPEEIERTRAQMRAGLLMGKETSGYRAEELGRHYTCFGKHISLKHIKEELEKVNAAQLQKLLDNITSSSALTFAAVGPVEQLPSYNALKW